MSVDLVQIRLEPLSVVCTAARGAPLLSALATHGIEFPCGGTGVCGGCGVRVLEGLLPVTAADQAHFSAEELAGGWRLACQARAEEPLVLECRQWRMDVLTDNSSLSSTGKSGLGIAIDLGTTTIVAQMIDLSSGRVLSVETGLNPQTQFGSDVMSRIQAALSGADLTATIRAALRQMIEKVASGREQEIAEVILVGNTVMHHLFSGLNVEPLSHTPFVSFALEEQHFRPQDLRWPLPPTCSIRFARCLGGFVGSDILAGIVATGMTRSNNLVALVDLGTNGEIAIGNRDGVVCASTAAGPAFEAGSIRMGMRAVTGAIAHLSLARGVLRTAVIGDVEPRGICGSGLVDVAAVGLESRAILASGRFANGARWYPVSSKVVLWQSDIRELQLAKAAIASGFRLLLKRIGAGIGDLERIHLAGAFGNYVRIESAIRIGLIESAKEVVHAAGNTALRGAKMLLTTGEPQLAPIEHVSLATVPGFEDEFVNCMAFPETGTENCILPIGYQ